MIFTSLKENNSPDRIGVKQIFFFNASFNHFFNAKFFMSKQNAILLMWLEEFKILLMSGKVDPIGVRLMIDSPISYFPLFPFLILCVNNFYK